MQPIFLHTNKLPKVIFIFLLFSSYFYFLREWGIQRVETILTREKSLMPVAHRILNLSLPARTQTQGVKTYTAAPLH